MYQIRSDRRRTKARRGLSFYAVTLLVTFSIVAFLSQHSSVGMHPVGPPLADETVGLSTPGVTREPPRVVASPTPSPEAAAQAAKAAMAAAAASVVAETAKRAEARRAENYDRPKQPVKAASALRGGNSKPPAAPLNATKCAMHEEWTRDGYSASRNEPVKPSDFEAINEHQMNLRWATNHQSQPVCAWNFTLVTQASPERLWMMQHICGRWEGPIVLAIYVDYGKRQTRFDTSCRPGQVKTVNVPAETKMAFLNHNLYPVNRMRNVAISHVKTTHFLLVDIDLWPDTTLLTRLLDLSRMHPERFEDPQRALVVAAFAREVKTDCASSTSVAESAKMIEKCHLEAANMPRDFPTLRDCIIKKKCHIFDRYNQDGHGTTDYKHWLKMESSKSIRDVKCFLSNRYEPYVVLRNSPLLPKFEERFTGYGKNKIEHLVHLRYSEWKFTVLPKSFIIHFPHHKSAARLKWEGGEDKNTHREKMDKQYKSFIGSLIDVYGSPGDRSDVIKLCSP